MTEAARDPMFEVHKKDVRKKFRKSSEVLERELKKGLIKKKRPQRIVDVGKEKEVSTLAQTMRGQYILGKLGSKMAGELDITRIPVRDMYTTCRLGYDGMIRNKHRVETLLSHAKNVTKPDILEYKRILSPLGNLIIGYKVLKHYCEKFIEKGEFAKAKAHYEGVKQQVTTIDRSMVDEPRIYHTDLTSLKRKHGVIPFPKKSQSPILYNVKGQGVRILDLFSMDELISNYEATHWGKHAFWQGAKTKAFREWLAKRT